jgi:hypothetical protein
MSTLHLTLKRQWFEMIQSGEKKEEYREIKPHWTSRLWKDDSVWSDFRHYTHIQFTNGYSKNSPSFTIECNGIRIGRGNPEWGAPTDRDVFILSLGKITANEKANN